MTTDFGTADGYVGAVKGVICSINPKARLVDLSHEIPSFDVVIGAFHLGCVFAFYPKGTIHLGVVDPGVGGRRRAILVKTKGHFFVGPDNGLFTLVTLRDPVAAIYELRNPRYFRPNVSRTFHGRDLFGPVAAHLSRGVSPALFGPRRPSLLTRPEFSVRRKRRGWEGQILFCDKFGNAFTNLHKNDVGAASGYRVRWRRKTLPLYRTYSEIPPKNPGALFGSSGFLEIALREDSFKDHYSPRRGDLIQLLAAS